MVLSIPSSFLKKTWPLESNWTVKRALSRQLTLVWLCKSRSPSACRFHASRSNRMRICVCRWTCPSPAWLSGPWTCSAWICCYEMPCTGWTSAKKKWPVIVLVENAEQSWAEPYFVSIAHQMVYSDERFESDHPARVLSTLDQQVGHLWNRYVYFGRALQEIWKERKNVVARKQRCWLLGKLGQTQLTNDLQSKCFRLGAMTSSVVALTTARPSAEPATVCLAAFNLSTILWPDMMTIMTMMKMMITQ